MSKFLELAAVFTLLTTPALAQYDLGRAATDAEVAAWDIDVRPDGAGLPQGSGDVYTGEEVFAEKCAVCHGDFGEAVGRWPVLAGGHDTLTDDRPVKTIGSYWPYLSTVWDYVYRAMPFGDAQSLTHDEVYAITAYLLYVNDIVDDEFELSHDNFLSIRLPNEGSFLADNRAETELAAFSAEPCMTDCKEEVEITMRAAVLDVTPEETKARQLRQAVEAVRNAAPKAAAAAVEPATEGATFDAALVEKGGKVFRKCKACHKLGEGARNGTGPMLNDIVGAAAGQVKGFRYSKPLMQAAAEGLVWDKASLAAFLKRPRKFMKGTKMSFAGLKKDSDIDAVIEFLRVNGGVE